MALKKNTQDTNQVNPPVLNGNEKPFLLKTDLLIFKKIQEKNLQLVKVDIPGSPSMESVDPKKIFMEAIDCFKKELLLSHPETILLFYEYCFDPFGDFFLKNVTPEKMLESSGLMTLSLMAAGFRAGLFEFAEKTGRVQNPDKEYFEKVIPTLFTKAEFKEIIDSAIYLLRSFPEQIKKAHKWLLEDIEPKKNQVNALLGMMEIIEGISSNKINPESPEVKSMAKKTIDECLTNNLGHKIFGTKEREIFGIYTPDKELLQNISRIFNYLDILFYGKYVVVPTEDKNDLRFECLEFVFY